MRFLCLHGRGTSAEIFHYQTASFRLKLGIPCTFDFVDGSFPCTPAPDIAPFYRPPYYSYYESNTVTHVRDSHKWLLEKIARDGPYDGVMLFSQGCNVIASFLLYHQVANPEAPPPFKVAVFICGGISLRVLEDLGMPVSQEAYDWEERMRVELMEKNDPALVLSRGRHRWESSGLHPSHPIDLGNVFGLNLSQLPAQLRIQIPTVHIYGSKDPRYPASLQLSHLCSPESRRTYDHRSGHDIPRTKEVSEAIASLIRWSAQMAGQQQSR